MEVLSPGNTEGEMQEKMALYFDASAQEVWLCSESGGMSFFGPSPTHLLDDSKLCPQFPKQIDLP